jgi:hypothetical protein
MIKNDIWQVRKVTNQIFDMLEEGVLDKDTVIAACLSYMSEAEVADMARANGFTELYEANAEDEA